MNLELRQSFQIESARFLPHLPSEHPCRQIHGHSFKITMVIIGARHPQIGWVRDYHEIDQVMKAQVLKLLDHKLLNDVPGLENPTSENLAIFIYDKLKVYLPELQQIIINETPQTECRYPVISAQPI